MFSNSTRSSVNVGRFNGSSLQLQHMTVLPAVNSNRENPSSIKDLETRSEELAAIEPCLVDHLWTLIRYNCINNNNNNNKIPNWTGFNYLITDIVADCHKIFYFPSLNSNPTQIETVQEMLYQTKSKGEKLQLEEVDFVCDHSIYCKALEVLMLPTN